MVNQISDVISGSIYSDTSNVRVHSDSSIFYRIRNLVNTILEYIRGTFEQRHGALPPSGCMMTQAAQGRILWRLRTDLRENTLLSPLNGEGQEISSNMSPETYAVQITVGQNGNSARVPLDASARRANKYVISVVVQGNGWFARKHNVLVSLDFANGQLRYYDPKGKPAEEYAVGDQTVRNYLDEIAQRFDNLPIQQVILPSDYRQKDIHSCGYYVSLMMGVEAGLVSDREAFRNPRQSIISQGWAS